MASFDFNGTTITEDTTLKAQYCCPPPAPITLTCLTPGTVTLRNRWTQPVLIDKERVESNATITRAVEVGRKIKFEYAEGYPEAYGNWRDTTYNGYQYPLLSPGDGATFRISVPDMTHFMIDKSAGKIGPSCFSYITYGSKGAIAEIEEGSFDTSRVTEVGDAFFNFALYNGSFDKLPEGSFDTSNITKIGNDYFRTFLSSATGIKYLPKGSFKINSAITSVPNGFFSGFAQNSSLAELPEGSFDITNIITAGSNFFSSFNSNAGLTLLPPNFTVKKLESVGDSAFASFNNQGALESLPEGSFTFDSLKSVGASFCSSFNSQGKALKHLPEGSFRIEGIGNNFKNYFFSEFNYGGSLEDLPEGSFNTSNITSVPWDYFFSSFAGGRATFSKNNSDFLSLPEGSFDTSNIKGSVGSNFFNNFVSYSIMPELPKGSFNISGITSVKNGFFNSFCYYNTTLLNLPDGSFDTSNITSAGDDFFAYFHNSASLNGLPQGSFNFSKLETMGNSGFNNFSYSGGYKPYRKFVLPEGSFRFDSLKSMGNNCFSSFNYLGSGLQELPKGSFNFNNLETAGNACFYIFNNYGGGLKGLPAGSFNFEKLKSVGSDWMTTLTGGSFTALPWGFGFPVLESAGTGFMRYFGGGNLKEGNRGVKIYAVTDIMNFNVGAQIDVPKGSYAYVNADTEGMPSLQGLKQAMQSGDLSDYQPGTEIYDTWNGEENPLVVAQYLDSSNNSLYGGAEGAILLRKYIMPSKQKFGSSTTDSKYPMSLIKTYLDTTYLESCSDELKSAISTIDIPWSPTWSNPTFDSPISSKWFLMSGDEINITRTGITVVGEGIPFQYFIDRGATLPGKAQIMTTPDGSPTYYWLRDITQSTGSNVVVHPTGGTITYAPTNEYGVLPACFISKN